MILEVPGPFFQTNMTNECCKIPVNAVHLVSTNSVYVCMYAQLIVKWNVVDLTREIELNLI